MKMKHKPKMGTKLVPSIENLEGCYKYGGEWDHKEEICFERRNPDRWSDYEGCTAPIKGMRFCWGGKNYGEADYFSFVDQILAATGDVVHSDTKKIENLDSGKFLAKDAYTWAKQGDKKEEEGEKRRICCNPRGKIIGCNEPNAIITNTGENITAIAHHYRNKFGDKVLSNILPVKRKYGEIVTDDTIGTKFSELNMLPALESKEDSGHFFGIYDKYVPEKTPRQISLKKEHVPRHKTLREKLVPSVETPGECFKWGGMWDDNHGLCLTKRGWCTAPIKGVECCWGATETEDMIYHHDEQREEWVDCFEPWVHCRMLHPDGEPTHDEKHYIYDTWETGYFSSEYESPRFPTEQEDAEAQAWDHGIDTAKEILKGQAYGLRYYTPLGIECEYDNPNAVAADDPEKVIELYRGQSFKHKKKPEKPKKPDSFFESSTQRSLIDFHKK